MMNIQEAIDILGKPFGFSAVDTNPVIQKLNLPKTSRILDVGTGRGALAITLALNGYAVVTGEPKDDTSVYANQDWLDSAKKMKVDHKIKFQAFNAASMPFDDGHFDVVFSLGSFHHIEETERKKVIDEFIRITTPEATICIFEPNQKAIAALKAREPDHPDGADPLEYIDAGKLICEKINGQNFDAFVIRKI